MGSAAIAGAEDQDGGCLHEEWKIKGMGWLMDQPGPRDSFLRDPGNVV
jgi:hypothetical protein